MLKDHHESVNFDHSPRAQILQRGKDYLVELFTQTSSKVLYYDGTKLIISFDCGTIKIQQLK